MDKKQMLENIKAHIGELAELKKKSMAIWDEERAVTSLMMRDVIALKYGEECVKKVEALVGKTFVVQDSCAEFSILTVARLVWEKWEVQVYGDGMEHRSYGCYQSSHVTLKYDDLMDIDKMFVECNGDPRKIIGDYYEERRKAELERSANIINQTYSGYVTKASEYLAGKPPKRNTLSLDSDTDYDRPTSMLPDEAGVRWSKLCELAGEPIEDEELTDVLEEEDCDNE